MLALLSEMGKNPKPARNEPNQNPGFAKNRTEHELIFFSSFPSLIALSFSRVCALTGAWRLADAFSVYSALNKYEMTFRGFSYIGLLYSGVACVMKVIEVE